MFGAGGAAVFGLGAVFSVRYIGNAQMRAISRDFRRVQNDMKGSTASLARFNAGMSALRWTGATVVLAAITRHIMGLYATSQDKWAKISTITGEGIRDLQQQFNSMILGTRFITDLHAAQGAMYDLLSAGVPQEHSVRAMEMVGTLAKATLGSIEDAVTALSTSYNLFFDKQSGNIEDFTQSWADSFAVTVKLFQTKLPQLSRQFDVVAGQAALMGHSIHDTLAVVGALITGGLGQRSGRAWSRVLMQIGKAQEALPGIRLTHTSGVDRGMALSPLELIDAFKDYFGGERLNVQQQQQLVKALDAFGARAVATGILMRDRIAEAVHYQEKYGRSQEMARKRMESLNEQRAKTKTSLKMLADTMTMDGVESLTKFSRAVQVAADWLNERFGGALQEGEEPTFMQRYARKTPVRILQVAGVLTAIAAVEKGVKTIFGNTLIHRLGKKIFAKGAAEKVATSTAAQGAKKWLIPTGLGEQGFLRLEKLPAKALGAMLLAAKQTVDTATSELKRRQRARFWWQTGREGVKWDKVEYIGAREESGKLRSLANEVFIHDFQDFYRTWLSEFERYYSKRYPGAATQTPIEIKIENKYANAPTEESAAKLAREQGEVVKKIIDDAVNNTPQNDYQSRRRGVPYSTVPMANGGFAQ